jgi:hypothetical protein
MRTPACLPTGDPRAHAAYPSRPRGRPSHRPTTSHNDGRLQADASPGPARPAQPRSPGSDEPVVDTAGEHADPGHPSHAATCPPPSSTTSPGRTQRTRERTDTGRPQRTPDDGHPGHSHARTGRRTPVAWTDTCGDWTSASDTGRRLLAEDVDTLTKARRASAPPGPPRERRALGHPTVFLWTAPAALGDHDGSAVGHLPARDCLVPCRVAARSLRRLSRASVHCCPRMISGRA